MPLIYLLFIIACALYSPSITACDVCGCGVGNYYWGIMPQFHKNFAGIRYRQSSFQSHFNATTEKFDNTEQFYTLELWSRYYILPKLQLLTFLPYNLNTQTEQNNTHQPLQLQGISDIAILTNYMLINTATMCGGDKKSNNPLLHNWLVGAGLKLPTGQWKNVANNATQNVHANMRLGSGSIDFLFYTAYTMRYKQWGINTDINYKLNTANQQNYAFGNKISSNLSLFYIQNIKAIALMPYTGLYAEHAQANREYGIEIPQTGGHLIAHTLGLETYYKRLSIGASYQIPIAQLLNANESKARPRLNIQMSLAF